MIISQNILNKKPVSDKEIRLNYLNTVASFIIYSYMTELPFDPDIVYHAIDELINWDREICTLPNRYSGLLLHDIDIRTLAREAGI